MTTSRKSRVRSGLLLTAALPGLLVATDCRQREVCEDVVGPCLALRVTGPSAPGMYDELRTALQLDAAAPTRTGSTTGDIQLPLTLRVVPPAGVLPSTVRSVQVAGLAAGTEVATAQTPTGFTWADDEHASVTLELVPPGGGTDGGLPADLSGAPADLAGPPADLAVPPTPTLKWAAEPNPSGKNELYHVWTGSGTQVLVVGSAGTALLRQSTGSWTAEATGTTSDLYGVFGIPGGSVWATGQNPGAWRRDGNSGKWLPDQGGLALGPQATVWAVTTGATAGEVWAGSDDGKVWHRTGSPLANGSWQSEQALPAGVTIYSVAYSDGAVFAVGQHGYAAVRKDTGSGARWQPAFQYSALAGTTMGHDDGLYGVFSFDRNTAVAVGSKGLLVRYTAGAWQTAPQTIDPGGNEFNAVWGTAAGRVWAVGYEGLIVRVSGATATTLRTDNNQSLYGIYGRSESDIYAVGSSLGGFSLILHGQP
ncbi:MAG TPA: hypothetical protein PLW65_25535 [Pseudomonadota bacterium]|nr:hypothetical protein [Pseudomonadota bacterium]